MWMEPLWRYEGADHTLKGPFSLWQLWQWYHIGHLYGCLKVCIFEIKNKLNHSLYIKNKKTIFIYYTH